MSRPSCVVRVGEMPGEKRPRRLPGPGHGVRSEVRAVGNATGLTRMGMWVRSFDPGFAGTHRHFHDVEEEWAYVLSGSGVVRIGPHRIDVRAGHFVGFPPGPRPHHFLATGTEPMVLLEGGERRPQEDSGWYVDDGVVWRPGEVEKTSASPPPERGDPAQCVHVDDRPMRDFQHKVDPRSRRLLRTLHRVTGLTRQSLKWSSVAVGDLSTAYHSHDRTDEWVYILEGRARVRVGNDRFEVAAGDFVAHPAGGPPHVMEPETDLTYLMGGQINADDIVTYPEAGVQLRAGGRQSLNPGS